MQSLKLQHQIVEEMHLQAKTLFDLDLGIKVTQNLPQYPLHHVTNVPAKFEVATFIGLGRNAFTKYII